MPAFICSPGNHKHPLPSHTPPPQRALAGTRSRTEHVVFHRFSPPPLLNDCTLRLPRTQNQLLLHNTVLTLLQPPVLHFGLTNPTCSSPTNPHTHTCARTHPDVSAPTRVSKTWRNCRHKIWYCVDVEPQSPPYPSITVQHAQRHTTLFCFRLYNPQCRHITEGTRILKLQATRTRMEITPTSVTLSSSPPPPNFHPPPHTQHNTTHCRSQFLSTSLPCPLPQRCANGLTRQPVLDRRHRLSQFHCSCTYGNPIPDSLP